MTPARIKAEELVDRFIGHPQLTDFGGMDDHIAIDCALICVEEMLIIQPRHPNNADWDDDLWSDFGDTIDEW